ncbi:MAG: hypothetical protein JST54_03890 [Deltaproteobacteria bacterium]|nr:hypothetical protein [Deltaproteobacteria bacterium]
MGESSEACPGCGLVAPALDGPRDPYGGSSPACWAAFGEVTAKDYGEFRYPEVHRLIVDAYMAQHAMFDAPAARRSAVVHLIGLHLALDRGLSGPAVSKAMGVVFPKKEDPAPLAPRPPPGGLTVASVLAAKDLEAHTRLARAWAASVWASWSAHHAEIRALADAAVSRARA